MGEHHRVQQADPVRQPRRRERGQPLQEPHAEEHHAQRLGRGAVPAGEPVGQERRDDEPSGERVRGEQARQPGHHAPGADQGEPPFGRELGAGLHARGERSSQDHARHGGRGERQQEALVRRDRREEPAEEGRPSRGQGAHRAGQVGHGVVPAERPVAVPGVRFGVRDHRLLQGGDGARFVRLGGEGPGERHGHQGRDPRRQGEDGAGPGHQREQGDVGAPPAPPVAPGPDGHPAQRLAGQHSREHQRHLAPRRPGGGQRGADQHHAEPVDEGPDRLNREDRSEVVHRLRTLRRPGTRRRCRASGTRVARSAHEVRFVCRWEP